MSFNKKAVYTVINPTPSSGINPQPKKKVVVVLRRSNGKRKRIEIKKTETVAEYRERMEKQSALPAAVSHPERNLTQQQKGLTKKQLGQRRQNVRNDLLNLSKHQLIDKILSYAAHVKTLESRLSGFRKEKKEWNPHEFYDSKAWRMLRYQVLKVYGRKCALCKQTDGRMHVDHIKPRSLHPELELVFDNLQVLCEACNLGKSNRDSTDFRTA
jgi:5-methylcytosine-specific restriction endonuclease McrA